MGIIVQEHGKQVMWPQALNIGTDTRGNLCLGVDYEAQFAFIMPKSMS